MKPIGKSFNYRIISAPITILTVALVYLLNIPNPMMILIIPVVFFSYADGYFGGTLSGLVSISYSLYFFLIQTQDPKGIEKALTIVLALTVIIVLVGKLKKNDIDNTAEFARLNHNFLNVLSGIDVQILVTDPVTDQVLFANEKKNTSYKIEGDPVGKTCWQVYQGLDSRCEFCPITELFKHPNKPVEWEYYNERTGRWYKNREAVIEWTDGKMVHLQQAVDVTENHDSEDILWRQLKQQQLMSSISSKFISGNDTNTQIYEALKDTGNFLELDRVTLSRVAKEKSDIEFISMWYRSDEFRQKNIVTPGASPEYLKEAFVEEHKPYIVCEDVNSDPVFFDLVQNGIVGFITAPIFLEGELYGHLSLEACSTPRLIDESDLYLAQMVASLISSVLLREQMVTELKDAKVKAEESAKTKSNFLANMSHEMRTPMNAIIGMTELAKSSDEPERVQYCISKVNDAAEHLLGVINDILDMSKIEAGKLELSNSDFLLENVLLRVSTVTNFQVEQKKQDFMIKVDKDVPDAIVSDSQRLTQVLTNLLSNAVKFTPDEGKISLYVHKLKEENNICTIQFDVVDSGIGISRESLDKLFQSFQQADNSISRRFGGTGLGLSISKRIVELMGGEIHAESEEGKGSHFSFTIQAPVGKTVQNHELGDGIDWNKVHILVVDDAPEVLDYFKGVTSDIGLHCICADSGQKALELMEEESPFHLIFIDWHMPDMDGIELTRRCREKFGDNIIVIMISAAEWNEIEQEARAVGVNDFISKPLLPSVIINSLNKCLGTRQDIQKTHNMSRPHGIFHDKNILLVEDIEINREILSAMLENTEVCIDSAENGRMALEMFTTDPEKYDLILMDIHMPEMDGYEATRQIRAMDLEKAKAVPIVAMTANVFKEDIEQCLQCGMNAHVGKPIDLDDLLVKLRGFLR